MKKPIRIGRQPPFAVPPERRDPARRLRGRLVAPVTVRAGPSERVLGPGRRGQPARLLGLIDTTSAFWEAMQEAGAVVAHVLAVGMVEGVIGQPQLPDLDDPLAYLHRRYRSVGDLNDHG